MTIAGCQKEIDECLAGHQEAARARDEEARQRRLEEAATLEVPAVLADICAVRNRDTPRNLRAYAEGVARAFDSVVEIENARLTLQTEVTRLNGEVTRLGEELERFRTQGAPSTANPAETRERLRRAEESAVRATTLLRETNRRYQAELKQEKERASAAREEKKKASKELQSAADAATIKALREKLEMRTESNTAAIARQAELREDLRVARANEKKVIADLAARDAELLSTTKKLGVSEGKAETLTESIADQKKEMDELRNAMRDQGSAMRATVKRFREQMKKDAAERPSLERESRPADRSGALVGGIDDSPTGAGQPS